jgi:hypothetical protein
VRNYERVYEELEDGEDNGDVQYIKLFNVGQKVSQASLLMLYLKKSTILLKA